MAVGSRRVFLAFALLAAAQGFLSPGPAAWGAMPELVGFVDLLTQADTAAKLDLSDAQREQLIQLADELEMEGADSLLKASRMPADEQQAALRPFRLESQRKALAILSVDQRDKLSALLGESDNPHYDSIADVQGEPPAADEPAATEPASEGPVAEQPAAEEPMEASPADAAPAEAADEAAPPTDTPAVSAAPVEEPIVSEPAPQPAGDGKLTFNFRFQPWEDVLGWFADQADLSLVLDAPPSGTFNYRDSRRYSIGEALDVLNNVLQTKGYTLVRKDRMLLLINLEDEIPPNLVTDVDVEDLDEHGSHELVRVLFQVRSMPSDDLAEELNAMVGPQGKIIVLSKANMIQVTETVGRIRAIRRVIESIDGPGDGDIRELALEHVMVDEALPIIRQMLGIASDALATPTGSLQLAVDPLGGKIFARGDADEIARVEEVLRLVDVENSSLSGSAAVETPQLEVYSTGGIDSELVLKVLQTLLADAPGARIAADAATGNLVALARPSDHATIRATLAQMQQDVRQVEVIPLDRVEPTLAKLAVDRLFNAGTAEEPDPKAPIVEADLNSYSLIVRATPPQIREIKNLLDQLEDSGAGSLAGSAGGTIRMVPLTGSAARGALEQVQQVWPAIRTNKIRIVTPSAESGIREYRPSGVEDREPAPAARGFGEPGMEEFFRWLDQGQGVLDSAPAREPAPQDPSAAAGRATPFRFAAQLQPSPQTPAAQRPTGPTAEFKTASGATIIVAEGPGGLLLASEDTDALDEFEDLLRSAAGPTAGGRQFAVFYLKYAEAGSASEILGAVFGASSGGGSLMGDIAGGVMEDMGAGMMGDLLGLGGLGGSSSGFSSAAVDIVPDMRLNALIVYANPQDLDMVEQLLKIVDQRTGPAAVEAGGRARMIVVEHSSASAVADVVKQVYADRLQGAGGGNQPSPQDLMRMLQRGGRGGGGGGGGASLDQEPSKMSISVDTRSNSLIVRAPDPLFEEVAQLVRQLDAEGLETPQATRVVSLQHTNPEAVKEALESLLGANAVTTNNSNQSSTNNNDNNRRGNNNNNADEMRRRIEFFRNLQRSREGGGGRGGAPGGGRGGRGGGGRGGGGRG